MNVSRTILVAGAVCLAAVTAFLMAGSGESAAPAETRSGTVMAVPAWSTGDERAYEVRVSSRIALALDGGEPGTIEQVLEGRLALRALEPRKLEAVLVDARLTVGGQRDESRSAALIAPFTVDLDGDGAVTDCSFDGELDESITGRLDELIRTFQVVGVDASRRSWIAREEHTDAVYEAEYQRDGDLGIEKRRVRSVSGDGARIVSSNARIRLDDGPWIASYESTEETVSTMPNGEARLSQRASLRAVAETGVVSVAFEAGERAAIAREEADARAEAARIANERRAPTADELARLDSLLAALTATDGRDVQALLALRDLLRACPQLSERIVDALRRDAVTGRVAAAVIHALELADHAPAHAALLAILGDGAQEQLDRVRAIAALGGTSAPDAEVIERMWSVADTMPVTPADAELTDTTRLSLGRLAASMRDTAPDRASAITDRLAASLDGARSAARASAALKALGNTGDRRAAPAVVARLDADDPAVRAAAAGAIARLDSDAAVPALSARLARETDGRVREALVDAMVTAGDPRGEAVDVVARQAQREDHRGALRAMALYLAPRLPVRPDLRPLLETMLRTESDDRARKALAIALSAPAGR